MAGFRGVRARPGRGGPASRVRAGGWGGPGTGALASARATPRAEACSARAGPRRPWSYSRRRCAGGAHRRPGRDGRAAGGIKGESSCLGARPRPARAEACLREAVASRPSRTAQGLGSCARPRASPGSGATRAAPRGPRPARAGLRLVHRGFDTPDLKEAKALLDELTSTPLGSRAKPRWRTPPPL